MYWVMLFLICVNVITLAGWYGNYKERMRLAQRDYHFQNELMLNQKEMARLDKHHHESTGVLSIVIRERDEARLIAERFRERYLNLKFDQDLRIRKIRELSDLHLRLAGLAHE